MTQEQRNNPLHGVKLEALLNELVDNYGWEILADKININCFKNNPSIKSSLKFLRKTEWAREKVERFYLYDYKKLPKPGNDQYDIPPRQRIIQSKKDNNAINSKKTPSKEIKTQPQEQTSSTGFNPWNTSRHTKK